MDLIPGAIKVLERVMPLGQPGYGSLHIVKTELERLRAELEQLLNEPRCTYSTCGGDDIGPRRGKS